MGMVRGFVVFVVLLPGVANGSHCVHRRRCGSLRRMPPPAAGKLNLPPFSRAIRSRGGALQGTAGEATAPTSSPSVAVYIVQSGVVGTYLSVPFTLALAWALPALRPHALHISSTPLETSLAVFGVLYSVLLGATLSAAMERQATLLHAIGAEIAALELLEGGLSGTPEISGKDALYANALVAVARHAALLERAVLREVARVEFSTQSLFEGSTDPLADAADVLAEAGCPPTALGARADLERVHMCRAARLAAEAGPHFWRGHWTVLQTLGGCAWVCVACVSAIKTAAAGTSYGAPLVMSAALVWMTGTALALADTIVKGVSDRQKGMYSAARPFLPMAVHLHRRLEQKAAAAVELMP